MQSSALPLGHAAVETDLPLFIDRISSIGPEILFLSNGHGEDLIAMRVLEEFHEIYPESVFDVLPLVGSGNAFNRATKENWLIKVGVHKTLPSGGFSNQSLRGLIADLFAGVISQTWLNWLVLRKAARNKKLIVAVGDLLPLFFAWSSGVPFVFFGAPKSDYTWTTQFPNRRLLHDAYHRLKGTEWEPWECLLMRSSLCRLVAVRDKLSARSLKRLGVNACFLGNPMMDGFNREPCPDRFIKSRRLILLCGSRMPEAYINFKRLVNAAERIDSDDPMIFFVPISPGISMHLLEVFLKRNGYVESNVSNANFDAKSCWKSGSKIFFIGVGAFHKWATWGEIGLANAGTATEQLVGLGIPCFSLPGSGPQFTFDFAHRQSRLLGGAAVPCSCPEILAKKVEYFLLHKSQRHKLALQGQRRMGLPGASYRIASLIDEIVNKS